jgi:predicted alpha-1,2-mannosidase
MIVRVIASAALVAFLAPAAVRDPAEWVDTWIGSANGGNTFPGADLPFGMLQWSPEATRGDATRAAAPGGYAYDVTRIRGFSLTHLSGTGCRGASGDIPFMPIAGAMKSSPSADSNDRIYASRFAHANETAAAGYYQVRFENGINVELTATPRTGSGRFSFPPADAATMLVRVSDTEVGSSDAHVSIDRAARTIRGEVTSGNFCGYLGEEDRRSYYTLHFIAVFDRPFADIGTWHNADVTSGAASADGGTTYGTDGYPVAKLGSGAYVAFDAREGATINVRVGISYVSAENADANLRAENPAGTSFDAVRSRAREAWNRALGSIQVSGGTASETTTFYTALYHALLHPNLFSDVNGEYFGFDAKPHKIAAPQKAQYANFSGWDVYRDQLQLVTLVDPQTGSDIAQSLLNQAEQSGGEWDRWTHNSGETHVMEGDAAAPAVASIYAFGGTAFDAKRALASLVQAAEVPTAHDLSSRGCSVACVGQRPSLDKWLTIHYIPAKSNAWGGAGETLEDATADFSISQLAARLGDEATAGTFLERAQYWKNLMNDRGYVQNRNEDGSWPPFDPASSQGFAEGSSAQYTWMVPFNAHGLFDAMGGVDKANARLDAFFHNADGSWALTRMGGTHAELDNEPSIGAPWLYLFSGKPYKTQETVREAMKELWSDRPYGLPGNDDLGAMSAWFVWSAIGFYPGIPGRAELLIGSPLFPTIAIRRANGTTIRIAAANAAADAPYVQSLRVNRSPSTRSWLPESFIQTGGTLEFALGTRPNSRWGAAPRDSPPSFDR